MKNKQHHYLGVGVILFVTALPLHVRAVQPMSESTLALQTGILNNALPIIIMQAKQDALQPAEQRWRAQRVLSDRYLREIRINTILGGGLSPHQEQKKVMDVDVREKKNSAIKPHEQPSDRLMIYDFDNGNVHVTYTDDVRAELVIK